MSHAQARPELTGVAGVPETQLDDALLGRLPVAVAAPPWTCAVEAVVWFDRGGPAAGDALPPALRGGARALAVVGAVVRYRTTPVGPYDEVVGLVGSRTGLLPWGSAAFMAVDSEPSLVGGRINWALPKTLASFEGDIASGSTIAATGAGATRWRVRVTPRAHGPRLPVPARGRCRQQFPGGVLRDSRMSGRARIRAALVTVEVESEGPLATWLQPGRRVGALVESATFRMTPPGSAEQAGPVTAEAGRGRPDHGPSQ